MGYFAVNTAALLVGAVLDAIIGDPEGWPHPVIWIGKYISHTEKKLRARGGNLRRGAVWLTFSTAALAMLVTAALLWLMFALHFWAGFGLMCLLSWSCLSAKCLAVEGKGVARALERSLEDGRRQVGRIVGRDTANLSESEILRATVETVAENTTDGIISPLLYLFLGGPVLAMGFKAVSTLDSMVGYLDEKYRDIGWSSARLDDVLNFLPARLCAVLMCLGAFPCGMDGKNAFRIMKRDHGKHLSPNCAWSEAAAAGALHIQLGGTHDYFGKKVEKPAIGEDDREIEPRDIRRTVTLMYAAEAIAVLLLVLAGLALS